MDDQASAQALLERACRGDRRAFDILASDCRDRLAALIWLRMGKELQGKIDLEDLMQETMLRAFRTISGSSFETERQYFRWLATIAEHVIVDVVRWHRSRPSSLLEHDVFQGGTSPSRRVRREERFDRLQEALDKLAPTDREVIILARIQELSLGEIATRMDRTRPAVAQVLSRALKRLRTAFGESTESLRLPDRLLRGQEAGDE